MLDNLAKLCGYLEDGIKLIIVGTSAIMFAVGLGLGLMKMYENLLGTVIVIGAIVFTMFLGWAVQKGIGGRL